MKILFPVEVFYPSQAGGPANTVYWLAKGLKEKGFEPVIVASDKGISDSVVLNKWTESDAGRLIYIKTFYLHVPLKQTLTSILNLSKADVVHLSSVFYPTAFLTALAARLLGKKIAWSPRGELSEYSLNYSGGRKRPILWLIKKLIGDRPVFHSTSDEETAQIKNTFGPKARIFQIPNYIEVEPEVRTEAGRYFLYIGRFHPKKGIENLIRALKLSAKFADSGLVLKVAGKGKGDYEGWLRQLVNELGLSGKVEFVGQVEGVEKSELLAGAHFSFMPSHTENFGIVVLESLAQGTPVVASIHTPWQSLEDEKIGFWTDNSPEVLAGTIDKIIGMDPTDYAGYRERSRPYVLREFDIRNHIDEWLALYQALKS